MQMLIRLLAVVFSFGLLVGSVEARPAELVSGPTAALVDEAEADDADITLVVPLDTPHPEGLPSPSRLATDAPAHYKHLSFVFRPPRGPAFN